MTNKKNVPRVIKIPFEYNIDLFEQLFKERIENCFDKGYGISKHDLNIYCALILYYQINLPPNLFNYAYDSNNCLKNEVQFELINWKINFLDDLDEKEIQFFNTYTEKLFNQRRKIILEEIRRTGISLKNVEENYPEDWENLNSIIEEFREITLINWYTPIRLSFRKLVHIYVKHVDATKFGDGQFKKRTFFSYHWKEIIILIKSFVKKHESKIKDRFSGFGENTLRARLEFNGDNFSIQIDRNGEIAKFHELS
jgi:hypothetical protein